MSVDKILGEFTLSSDFVKLFELTSGILCFVKDVDCRLITANNAFLEHFNLPKDGKEIDKSDFDLFSIEIAQRYYEDDLEVLKKGQTKTDIVELFPNHQGDLEWFITTKIPLHNKDGEVTGLCGVLQSYNNSNHYSQGLKEISKALDFIKENYQKKSANTDLAELCGLSVRQFESRFKDIFKTTPHQYVLRMKILKACQMIVEAEYSIAEIASILNFYDQSAFTTQFKKQVGETPLQYIKQRGLKKAT